MPGSLAHLEKEFASVGWFIPPYVQSGGLSRLAATIRDAKGSYDQKQLERVLSVIYDADALAAMVVDRYSVVPLISDFQSTIAEAIEAHFMGLNRVATAGLLPVIEGVGRRLAINRGLLSRASKRTPIVNVFVALTQACKDQAIQDKIGDVEEIESMMDAFSNWAKQHLYEQSERYQLSDKTNRHGIMHGDYADIEYGAPINFYKLVSALDFLVFLGGFKAILYCFAPDMSAESKTLSQYYRTLPRLKTLTRSSLRMPA